MAVSPSHHGSERQVLRHHWPGSAAQSFARRQGEPYPQAGVVRVAREFASHRGSLPCRNSRSSLSSLFSRPCCRPPDMPWRKAAAHGGGHRRRSWRMGVAGIMPAATAMVRRAFRPRAFPRRAPSSAAVRLRERAYRGNRAFAVHHFRSSALNSTGAGPLDAQHGPPLRNPGIRAGIAASAALAGWRYGRGGSGWWQHSNGGYGWVGPLFWPFAYFDIYDYAIWGYGIGALVLGLRLR